MKFLGLLSLLVVTNVHASEGYAVGAALKIGGGGGVLGGTTPVGLFELAPRAEIIFPIKNVLRGPAIEFRSANFQTAELTGAIALAYLFDDSETGVLATIGGDYGWRLSNANGALFTTSLEYGLLRLNSILFADTSLYVSFRHSLSGPQRAEFTTGVVFGGGILNTLLRFSHL